MLFRHRAAAVLAAAVFAIATANARAAPFSAGDFITYSQESWGGNPTEPAAQLLLTRFDGLYTGELEVGAAGATGFSMAFTSAVDVLSYLPGLGSPGFLSADLVNPSTTGSGVTGGEVLALQLNVDFSDAHYLTGAAGIPFGNMVLTGLSSTQPFNGLTVRQFLAVSNSILGFVSPNPTTDDELAYLLADVNRVFSGVPSQFAQDHLRAASSQPVPEPATFSLFGIGVTIIGVRCLKRRS